MTRSTEAYRCDGAGCGARRENDANHWWVIYKSAAVRSGQFAEKICIEPWNDRLAAGKGRGHACGIDCALKIAAGLMDRLIAAGRASSAGQAEAGGSGGHDGPK